MRASCSSIVVDDFDDFHEKTFYSSTNNSISLINDIQNNDLPFFDDFSEEISKKKDFLNEQFLCENSSQKTLIYDQQLANLIENELGLNDCQTSRKNAWGNLSYAELIAKAIENSSQQRLTLSQIYSWMILYVPYFRDKADKKSSTGWKNSIRHNLSLHNCFVRIPNEIAGKSSCEQLKTIDRSNPLFRRMVLTIMRHQMNKNKLINPREKILSTPPPTTIEQSQLNTNSTFDLDIEPILDFQRTNFDDFHQF
ncbi:hypothetical protein I4U23_010755 [Adineta vaga]|nr:hypothetical protein I4U23_010755 [Adineta vaga]